MVNLIFTIVANCAMAVFCAFLFSYFDAHAVRFVEHWHTTEKVHERYSEDDEYRSLVNQYKQLSESWISTSGANVAKWCLCIVLLLSFISTSIQFCADISPALRLITVVFPTALTLLIIILVNKSIHSYVDFMKNGRGQYFHCRILGVFIDVVEKHSYIENINDINEEINDIDRLKLRYRSRIAACKRLQNMEQKHSTYFLMFSTILATFCFALSLV